MPLPPRDFTQIGPNEGEILATLGATPGGIGDLARGLSGAQLLRGLDDAGWQRRGTSPSRGPLTIEQYARSVAEHDREHLEQFEKTRARIEARP